MAIHLQCAHKRGGNKNESKAMEQPNMMSGVAIRGVAIRL